MKFISTDATLPFGFKSKTVLCAGKKRLQFEKEVVECFKLTRPLASEHTAPNPSFIEAVKKDLTAQVSLCLATLSYW